MLTTRADRLYPTGAGVAARTSGAAVLVASLTTTAERTLLETLGCDRASGTEAVGTVRRLERPGGGALGGAEWALQYVAERWKQEYESS